MTIPWRQHEIAILRNLFPRGHWPDLLHALPQRTREAIRQKALPLGICREAYLRAPWRGQELAQLFRLYPAASDAELREAFPNRTLVSVQRKGSSLGIRRKRPETRWNKRFVHPIFKQLRTIREAEDLTRSKLSKKCGYHYNQILAWEMGKANPDFRSVREWAEALGYEIVLKKSYVFDNSPIPFPDKKRLMAGS